MYTHGKTSLYNTDKLLCSCYKAKVVAHAAAWTNMQTHPKPGITLLNVGIQDFVISLFTLYSNIFFVSISEEACISSSYTHVKAKYKPAVADLSQCIKNQLPITPLGLILWCAVTYLKLRMKLPPEVSWYTRLEKF